MNQEQLQAIRASSEHACKVNLPGNWERLGHYIPDLLDEIERLRGVLGFYANTENWEMKTDVYMGFTTYDDALVESDKGEKARQALAGESV